MSPFDFLRALLKRVIDCSEDKTSEKAKEQFAFYTEVIEKLATTFQGSEIATQEDVVNAFIHFGFFPPEFMEEPTISEICRDLRQDGTFHFNGIAFNVETIPLRAERKSFQFLNQLSEGELQLIKTFAETHTRMLQSKNLKKAAEDENFFELLVYLISGEDPWQV